MKSSIFNKSLKVLIIVLLLSTVVFNRKLSQQLMLAAILIWIILAVSVFFGPRIYSLIKKAATQWQEAKQEVSTAVPGPTVTAEETISPLPKAAPEQGALEPDSKRMLQHISLRITEKIKSAYPDATWRWDGSPNLTDILDGKIFRIMTDDMAQFTHADVHFDRYARIRIVPLIIGEFAEAANTETEPDAEVAPEPPVVDVISWYDLIGRKILEDIITDLNANGHSRLSIKENGDIVITRNKKEVLKGTLDQFPPKNYWNEFLQLLAEYELNGKVEKDRIIVSWT